ncbi:MAG: DUF1540 domain-containing protein [Clostridium sp.]|nr:DUF1540 domain-containing protein [Clostridium sp.]
MSGNLSCNAKNCIHNNRSLCNANNIHIRGANARSSEYTECGSFVEMGLQNSLSNVYNMNIGGEVYNSYGGGSSPQVSCDAVNCQYNINGQCTSNYVQVGGIGAVSSNRTECQSFRSY